MIICKLRSKLIEILNNLYTYTQLRNYFIMDPENEITKIKQSFKENNIRLYSHEDVTIAKKLGEGSFGQVFKATLEGKDVAIKLLDVIDFNIEGSSPEDTIKTIINELKAMTKIEHEQIPKFYGIWETIEEKNTKFGIIFSFIPGITLQKYLTDNYPLMKNSFKCEILLSLLNVIITLHKNGVIHGDINPANIMITPENKVVLLDF